MLTDKTAKPQNCHACYVTLFRYVTSHAVTAKSSRRQEDLRNPRNPLNMLFADAETPFWSRLIWAWCWQWTRTSRHRILRRHVFNVSRFCARSVGSDFRSVEVMRIRETHYTSTRWSKRDFVCEAGFCETSRESLFLWNLNWETPRLLWGIDCERDFCVRESLISDKRLWVNSCIYDLLVNETSLRLPVKEEFCYVYLWMKICTRLHVK